MQLEADLQTAALQSQTMAERAATQAAEAMADARSANVEVPRLDTTLINLQAELHARKIVMQQAQERALRLESELSAAQHRIGTAERKAAQAERRQSSLQKRMDDWDAFDPNLHAALNASLTPPVADDQIQPAGTAQPAGSEATVQSAHQGRVQAATRQSASRMQFHSALYDQSVQPGTSQAQSQAGTVQQSVQQGTFSFEDAPMFPYVQQAHASVQQAQSSAQQVQPPPAVNTGGAVDSTNGSDVTFRPVGAGGSSSGPNGGGTPPPFPSFAGSQRQQTSGL